MSYPYKTILLRRGTAAEWVAANPTLGVGEPGYETDTKKLKIGNGTDNWNTLPYLAGDSGEPVIVDEDIDDRVAALLKAGNNISIQYEDENNRLVISADSIPTDPLTINQQVNSLLTAGNYIDLNYNGSDELIVSVTGVQPSGSYANASHEHPLNQIQGLDVALSGKAPAIHNHSISDVSLLQDALDNKQDAGDYASLVNGKVPVSELPGFVQDIEEYSSFSGFPPNGSTAKLYLALNTNKIYRWSGSVYVEIVGSPGSTDAIPEGVANLYFTNSRVIEASPVKSVAGKTGVVLLTKADFGLGNVDNTKDPDKPISTATQAALNLKANTNHTHTSSSITDFNDAVKANISTEIIAGSGIIITQQTNPSKVVLSTESFQPAGNYAVLVDGRVPAAQLPSYIDEIQEYATSGNFPATGGLNIIYRDSNSGILYRWSGTTYISMATSIEGTTDNLSEGSTNLYFTAQRASAAAPVQSVAGRTGTVTLTKSDIGLSNVNNTSDLDKPVSTAQAAADTAVQNAAATDATLKVGTLQLIAATDATTKANAAQEYAIQRANHTGTQAINTITNLQTTLDNKSAVGHLHDDRYYTEAEMDTLLAGKQASGNYATLVNDKVPTSQLPSYVDDVLESNNFASLPVSGETGKIYVTLDNNKVYRWSGSTYVEISASPGSTDAVPEGSVNKYYTDARATAAAPVQSVDGETGNVTVRPRVVVGESLPGGGDGDTIYVRQSDNTIWSYDGAFQQITSPPTPHKSTHSLLGSDPLTPADIGAMHVAGDGLNAIVPRLGSSAAVGASSTVGGGRQNVANGDYSVIAGGDGNVASNNSSVVSGGLGNSAANSFSVIGGGQENSAIADYATVAGGQKNAARGGHSYIAGGLNNLAFSVGSAAAGTSNVAAQKVRRANSIASSGSNILVLNALASDFDNVGPQAIEIRYFTASSGWQRTTRTVQSASQIGDNVTLSLTSPVGGAEQWTDVTVLNTWEADTSAGQVVAGTNNIVCGLFDTVAGGIGNSAVGGYGFVGGGNNNSATKLNATVVGGSVNVANGSYAAVIGGLLNTGSANYSFIGGGAANVASANHSIIVGGQDNAASALHAIVAGGLGNAAAGDYSAIIGGARGKATRFGEVAHAAGRFVNTGDAQHCMLVARRQTTDSTTNQSLFLNGTSTRITIPAQTAWTFSIKLCAYNLTTNEAAWWVFRGGIRRNNSNATALIGAVGVDTGADASMTAASASVVADDANDALDIRVTGISGNTIRWVATIDVAQVSFGAP